MDPDWTAHTESSEESLWPSDTSSQALVISQPYPPRGTGRRKGHRKSRGGCLNCKARKIKCQETRPACGNCVRSNLKCEYTPKMQVAIAAAQMPLQLQSSPTTFTMSDMRSFHHFLTLAYPHLPPGREDAWTKEVPAFAHNYEFLMHAILALGDTHLSYLSGGSTTGPGVENHRLLAIKGLNDQFTKTERTGPENDAMLAACYALTFQSSYSGESLGDFLTLVRGCGTITDHILAEGGQSVLVKPELFTSVDAAAGCVKDLPAINKAHIAAGLASLQAIQPLCEREHEVGLVDHMIRTVELLETSSRAAYLSFVGIYDRIMALSHEEFLSLIDPDNAVGLLLQAHFAALETLLGPFLLLQTQRHDMNVPGRAVSACVQRASASLAPRYQPYVAWPLQFCAVVDRRPMPIGYLLDPEQEWYDFNKLQGRVEETEPCG